jgi:hypothetical protein
MKNCPDDYSDTSRRAPRAQADGFAPSLCLDFSCPQVYPELVRPAVIFFQSIAPLRILFLRSIKTATRALLFISRTAAIVAALGGLLVMAGCKPKTAPISYAPPPETSPHADKDEPTKEIPPDLYKGMPIYPGATVDHVHKPKGAMREILFSSSAQMPEMVAYYKEELKKNDFRITSSLIMPARKTWSCDFTKDGRPGSVMLFPSDTDKSRMTIDLIYEMPSKAEDLLREPKEDFDVEGPGPVAQKAPNPNTSN